MKKLLKSIILITLLLLSVTSLISDGGSAANGSGVGVKNTPPTFSSIEIIEGNDTYSIDVTVSDYNGRNDIYEVNVAILNQDNDNLLANFSYRQYQSNNRSDRVRIDTFEDLKGDYLLEEESTVERYVGSDWYRENTTITINFVIKPPPGKDLKIRAYDMNEEIGYYQGPITSETEVKTIIEGKTIPIIFSSFSAASITGVIIFDRINKNSLAETARKKMLEQQEMEGL